jgi:hypothetical protein
LLKPANDTWKSYFQARVEIFYDYIIKTPAFLKQNKKFDFSHSYGELFARSSRTVEPILIDVVDKIIPPNGACRLLEVGCGSGIYIKRACDRNPDLEVTDLELQKTVADFARDNTTIWQIEDPIPPEYDVDAAPLYEYCDEIFSKQSLTKLLCKAFMLRLVALRNMKADTIFVSNTEIIPLLTSMPIETGDAVNQNQTSEACEDVIALEIFRQILSPAIDPLNEKCVEIIAEYRNGRKDEISRLRNNVVGLHIHYPEFLQ